MRSRQRHLPILIGVNGRSALTAATAVADTIGLTMLGRTLPDGQHHQVRWHPEAITATVDHVRRQPGGRDVELNALIQAVRITDDRDAAAHELAAAVEGLTAEDALAAPFLALGSHDDIVAHLIACRNRWGITYFTVRTIDDFAPVIERLQAHDVKP